MKEKFITKRFADKSLAMLSEVQKILSGYETQGYDLSLRQLYYQLVSRNLVENTELSYKRVGDLLNNARLAGLVDWDILKDRGRNCRRNNHWTDPAAFLEETKDWYDMDLWEGQKWYVEVMIEKQALEGVLLPVCQEFDVPFTSNKGYASVDVLYRASKRFLRQHRAGKKLAVIYLGDHDPSGMDMTRDVADRLAIFTGGRLDIDRVALNMPQIEQYEPPENPAKTTDSRSTNYIEQYGESSWELDALEPSVLASLVKKAIEKRLDKKKFNARKKERADGQEAINDFAEEYRNREEQE